MTTILIVIAKTKIPMVKKTPKLSFKIVEVVKAAIIILIIKEIKTLTIQQLLESTIYS